MRNEYAFAGEFMGAVAVEKRGGGYRLMMGWDRTR